MISPPFKWPGGKRQLLDTLFPLFHGATRIVEPFFGSGIVSANAGLPFVAGDVNRRLVGVHRDIRDCPDDVIAACRPLFDGGNDEARYYAARDEYNDGAEGLRCTALFLYLNAYGFNGLYRENSKGGFNVPFGTNKDKAVDAGLFEAWSRAMRRGTVQCSPWQETIREARAGDVVYLDPPYAPASPTASFASYSAGGFGWEAQRELADAIPGLVALGCRVVVSNHDTPEVRALYSGASRIITREVRRSISCGERGKAAEVVAVFGEAPEVGQLTLGLDP